jgi:hypothetical protein
MIAAALDTLKDYTCIAFEMQCKFLMVASDRRSSKQQQHHHHPLIR